MGNLLILAAIGPETKQHTCSTAAYLLESEEDFTDYKPFSLKEVVN